MDFSAFDTRGYPTVQVQSGYDEWAGTYDEAVRDEMDLRLFDRIQSVGWESICLAVDLACGTGRVGGWLRQRGVAEIIGLDCTPAMLDRARSTAAYRELLLVDMRDTRLETASADLVTLSLADEHIDDLAPLYAEAARLLKVTGRFVIVGYHPQFLMSVGMPTHFHRSDGDAIAIETYVHLLSDHVRAAHDAGLTLREMHEGRIDDEYVSAKPKWRKYMGLPISFAFVWERPASAI